MTSEIEPAKLLLPFLQRADELQKHEPLVAYYCRLYAMERGLKIPQKERTKTTNALLVSLMKQLEKDKKSLTLGPDDHLHVEGFALNVFSKADKQDRAGRADLNTAKTFYAASIFFDTLNQFSEVQPDLEQKQKYAAWKAADIRKALKEGREPLPGPPGGDDDLSMASSGEYDLERSRTDDAIRTDPSRMDHCSTTVPDSDSSPQQYDTANLQHSNISPQPSNITRSSSSNISSPHHYPTDDYPSDNFHEPPPSNSTEHSIHRHQSYQPEVPQHLPQHYPSHNAPSYSYPNFHSYPSFTESSLPTAPSHYPSYHQHSDDSHPNLPPSNTASYPSSVQYNSISRNGSVSDPSSTTAPEYEYDSSYQPPPEQIAEAQKAARFAVGALAFDDVFVAVDHLKKSLELLTKPSAGH
ncbi:hydroxyproline-rich glycoprotein family protein [Perilla frutescens var. hirtella]|uniref:Hydroxyproline-rich glycoprotein family protein n=1 Tax=Perilla frutescens var. hirtella TaxID=608512 RepID=A0AAD4JLR6_PERFH|nr:hydroxyproline-rich glycoprotein family protein [Perilla frutescens var. hirtella]